MYTIRDVAKKASVSVTTVSHFINKTRPISEELQQRIQSAMNELDYQPNALARSLRRKKTHTIGLIIPDNTNPFFAEVARGIEDTSFANDHSVILCNSDASQSKWLTYTNLLIEKQVDGLVFVSISCLSEVVIRSLQVKKFPLVLVDCKLEGMDVDSVLVDNCGGARAAVHYLASLGHRRIACISGPSENTPSADRVLGYRQALSEQGIPIDEELIVRGDFQYMSGYEKTLHLLRLDEPPTAIFSCNDLMAVGVVRASPVLERHVPATLSVIGFDDISLAYFFNPPLTTVAQPKYEMGVVAAQLLLERIQNRELPPRQKILDTRLIIRESVAPPDVSVHWEANNGSSLETRKEVE